MKTLKLDQQKRQHRERAQPLHRQRLGLLEKHQDYVKRARDFHSKEDRLQRLREKAAGRNKDEFYFGMIRSRTNKGVHIQSRGNEGGLDQELVKVLKTQDAGYIRTLRAIEQKKVDRLQQQIDTLISVQTSGDGGDDMDLDDWDAFNLPPTASTSSSGRTHIVFTNDLEAARSADPSQILSRHKKEKERTSSAHEEDESTFDGSSERRKPSKRRRKSKNKSGDVDPEQLAAEEQEREEAASAHRASLTTELTARQGRLAQLSRALRELEMQRLLMGKGAKKALVPKKGKKEPEIGTVEEWKEQDERKGKGTPEALDEGVGTGARVWKWKAQRKR
ncbi:small-subunit processome [Meredithblackwellia eburnea MCA 4105]